jgi:acetoin utilization protein AcuB
MFSIHGITGQTFRGTLEHLIQVPGVLTARHARGINREGEEIGVEAVAAKRNEGSGQEQAVAAYRRMLPRELERGPLYHAAQIMRVPVLSARGDDPVLWVWSLLAEHGIRQVPVLDASRHLVGLVSDRDLLTVLNVENDRVRDLLEKTVAEVMQSPVVAAAPVTDIRRIARVMLEYRQSGVPIVDEREILVGFVSRGDILRAVTMDPPLSLWA